MITFDLHIDHAPWEDKWPLLAPLADTLTKDALAFCGLSPGAGIEVEVMLCNDAMIQTFNAAHRQCDAPTNVLSFPQFDSLASLQAYPHRPLCLGSIIMSLETLEKEAIAQKKTFVDHGGHLFLHSMLHLLGYDHLTDADAAEMEKIEIDILAEHNIVNPYIEQ